MWYDAVKIDGPKKKILEFNGTDNFMDEKDLKVFETLCEQFAKGKEGYPLSKINDYHSKLMDKLLGLPIEKVFPCLDLYRIFLTHPDSVCHFKKFEEGALHLNTILGHISDKSAADPAKMCGLRCLVNMFRD